VEGGEGRGEAGGDAGRTSNGSGHPTPLITDDRTDKEGSKEGCDRDSSPGLEPRANAERRLTLGLLFVIRVVRVPEAVVPSPAHNVGESSAWLVRAARLLGRRGAPGRAMRLRTAPLRLR